VSDLTPTEKRKLERVLGMRSGYVLDFSNPTFADFVVDHTGRDIYDQKYNTGFSGSKANRLRCFWDQEDNHTVAKLVEALLAEVRRRNSAEPSLIDECDKVVSRLRQSAPVADVQAITQIADEHDLDVVAKAVRDYIDKNEPEKGLDRLHTFVLVFLRKVCAARGITEDREKPLHSVFGEYVKLLRANGEIESVMTERILKHSISILEAFNDVRNFQSLAHDNKLLSYHEAVLIFGHVSGSLRFLREIEHRNAQRNAKPPEPLYEDVPF
jgi:hypothetical protein